MNIGALLRFHLKKSKFSGKKGEKVVKNVFFRVKIAFFNGFVLPLFPKVCFFT